MHEVSEPKGVSGIGTASGRSVVEVFAERVVECPGAVAVVCGDTSLTYGELGERADRLACALRGAGVGAESRVGLLLGRSVDVVVAMLGVLRAGAAYVPVNAGFPAERVRQVVEDSGAQLIVADEELRELAGAAGVPLVSVDAEPAGDVVLPSGVSAGSLAYVMFTSGSTGRAKGVAVTQGAVVALAADERFGSGAHGRVLFHSPHSFDAATYEVWVPLLNGGCVVVAEGEVSVPVVRDAVERHGVTGMFVTTALFGVLVEEDPECFRGLGEVWTGGDAVPAVAAARMLRACPSTVLVNGYGPTEATTFAVSGPLAHEEVVAGSVPLGVPMDDTRAYVLDAGLRPVGVGVAGELYLGGHGLARGYHGRPGLTAERFVADPFVPGQRLYRSGDVVRWRPEGRLEFLGRGDDQVKIRGFRIEPAEVEAALARCAGVGQVTVLAREDQPGVKRLAAYVVPDDASVEMDAVRAELARSLPEYMVPSVFVVLEALPLTANGKVDRRALPVPEFDSGQEYVAPRTPVEERLAGIWAEVLGIERVGIRDSFFDLGGDSILSIQVVSRARRAGLALSSRDVFVGQTVEGLAAELDAVRETADPAASTGGSAAGPLEPTPVGEWFFATHPVAPQHFAMTMSFVLVPDADEGALRDAVSVVLARHDILRATFSPIEDKPGSEGTPHDSAAGARWAGRIEETVATDQVFTAYDLDGTDDPRAAWDVVVREAQQRFRLERGPLVRVLYGRRPDGMPPWLTVTAHHLVIDGVSWRILLEDLEDAYAQARSGAPSAPRLATTSVRQWAARLNAHVARGGFDDQVDYWRAVTAGVDTRLPVDRQDGANTGAELDMIAVTLTPEQTQALLYRVPGRFRSQINDVLLAALARVLAEWTGRDRTVVNLEGHGRAELFEDVDLSGTVGWFTSIHPIALERPRAEGWAQAVRAVKRLLRAVPDQGVGYGALRYLAAPGTAGHTLADLPEPQISFNYLGRFDLVGDDRSTARERALFASELDIVGQDYSPQERRPHLIDVGGVVQDGRLTLTWAYSSQLYERETVERLAHSMAAALAEIAGFPAVRDETSGERGTA
ncbi:non-ribosomal peptide synthetase [Streptomyces sp. NL15-2K]|uniref:non-ribosomal peptide synthetase n=1 Tax=Streptomyces sp. NL15-2K TaxID=376149 RepID=UPI000F577974|nr:non-ribosomal peptide synthetase [Streptomyces sp. NL15-2K]GCB44678.1 hypothetical protein SNL152K_1968 [Streptomyces sp. NL15-2K]